MKRVIIRDNKMLAGMRLVVAKFNIKNRREVKRMTNLEIWSEETGNQANVNEGISVCRLCNKAEDEIRAGLVPLPGGNYNAAYKEGCN